MLILGKYAVTIRHGATTSFVLFSPLQLKAHGVSACTPRKKVLQPQGEPQGEPQGGRATRSVLLQQREQYNEAALSTKSCSCQPSFHIHCAFLFFHDYSVVKNTESEVSQSIRALCRLPTSERQPLALDLTMAGRRSVPSISSTCGICGYSACVCYKAAAVDAPNEYAPFGIYLNGTGGTVHSALGYGDPNGKFRSEVDGLQAGVNYLDTVDKSTELTPLNRIHLKSLNKLREVEGRNRCSRGQVQPEYSSPLRMTDLEDVTTKQSATLFCSPDSVDHKYDFNFGDNANPDELFPDSVAPVLLDSNDNAWKFTFDFPGNELDWPQLQCDYDSAPSAATTQLKSEPFLATREATLEEPSATTKKVPQKSQWETLQELRLSSRAHYMKFVRLTANYESRGIKMLRRMYGSSKGMLDAGMTTFGDVLDGNEPQTLKEIFAFTCLSYVISKLLQKHGRIESSHVLADTDRWRLAIKKEKDRLIYDQAVKIVWPEVDFLKEHSKEKDVTSTPLTPVSGKSNGTSLGNVFSATTQRLYVPSSMLAYGMTTSLDFDFLERARDMDCSNIGQDICSGLQAPGHSLDPEIQPRDHGFHDHLVGLLHETSTHENFMFADFLNIYDPPLENNLGPAFDEALPDITLKTHLPVCPPQIFQANEPVGRVNPKELGNYSPPIAPSDALVQTNSLQPEANGVPIVESLLGCLIKTAMFEVVVEFVKCMYYPFCSPFFFQINII